MKTFLIILSIPVLIVLFALPVLALSTDAISHTVKLAATLAGLEEIIVEIILWFVFFTVAAFYIYFVANTVILIDNNRLYRNLLSIADDRKTKEEEYFQKKALANIKSAEKRLVALGVIIALFTLICIALSSYLYLNPSILENMWSIIYYGVGILSLLIILYGLAFVFQKIKYASLPKDDLTSQRLKGKIQTIKKRLKFFLLCIMLLILLYFALLVVITKGVQDITS